MIVTIIAIAGSGMGRNLSWYIAPSESGPQNKPAAMHSGTAGEPKGSALEFMSLEEFINDSIEMNFMTYEAMEPVW